MRGGCSFQGQSHERSMATRDSLFLVRKGPGRPSTCGLELMSEKERGGEGASCGKLDWKKTALSLGSAAVFRKVRAERNIPVFPCFCFFVGVRE